MAAEPETGAITPTVTWPLKSPDASVCAASPAAAVVVVEVALPDDPHAVKEAAIARPSMIDVTFFLIVLFLLFFHPVTVRYICASFAQIIVEPFFVSVIQETGLILQK
jgi:hypothetical protein